MLNFFKLKDILKRRICKRFGHDIVEEVYAVRYKDGKYRVRVRQQCFRCGTELESRYISEEMSRAELLKRCWFIEENS